MCPRAPFSRRCVSSQVAPSRLYWGMRSRNPATVPPARMNSAHVGPVKRIEPIGHRYAGLTEISVSRLFNVTPSTARQRCCTMRRLRAALALDPSTSTEHDSAWSLANWSRTSGATGTSRAAGTRVVVDFRRLIAGCCPTRAGKSSRTSITAGPVSMGLQASSRSWRQMAELRSVLTCNTQLEPIRFRSQIPSRGRHSRERSGSAVHRNRSCQKYRGAPP
jgi:hypothetical protein